MELVTSRLCLRPFRESDFDAVHSYSSNPDNVTYMVWGPNDEESTRNFIKDAIQKLEQDPIMGYDFAIVLRETGEVIGGCGIYLDDSRQEGVLGWILHKNYWKFGFMTEAANELLRFGFEQLKLHRIYATCNTENYGSYRVMEKCGMLREAHFRKNRHGRVGDKQQWYDEFHYAMLADEWEMINN
ncbi:MAG: N-acetyltransferase [Anaerocolumna sp.]|jgi:RimJ/RimL family protein N-acetyltransferase|nr:N-acetyltransferase [Anaerocolumna sp.]